MADAGTMTLRVVMQLRVTSARPKWPWERKADERERSSITCRRTQVTDQGAQS